VSELGRIYPPNYYAYHLVSDAPTAKPGIGERIKARMYQRRLEQLLERLGKRGTVRLLDVGCADGRLLDWYKASKEGHRLETHGIEMSASAAAVARSRGHQVVTGRFEIDTELPAGAFDLILAYHVIEHVSDPRAFAQRAADLLAPGGLFVVATPNFDSADVRWFKRHWGGNHFPRHWTFYDAASMARLAENVGLRQERVDYQTNPVFWNWSFHSWLSGRFPKSRWPDRLFPTVDIFLPSPQSFVLLSIFTTADLVLRAMTRKTASMSSDLRKPQT
jgi:2-polyprenyl-3-methyl-5-hydroxy-6-metoxy-1,4-benzoquinol methylase